MSGKDIPQKNHSSQSKITNSDEASSDEELTQLGLNRQVSPAVAAGAGRPVVVEESTDREERLARKLKTIDSVTSPKSSFDGLDEEENNARKPPTRQVQPMAKHGVPPGLFVRSTSSAFSPTYSKAVSRMVTSTANGRHGVSIPLPERVTLVVDGTRFLMDPQLFLRMPDTMLGRFIYSTA